MKLKGKMEFDLDKYLERIGYSGPLIPNETLLLELHQAQHCVLPFENFDLVLGREIDLNLFSIFDKLVNKSRGGCCFELNALFEAALREIGFDVIRLLGRVHISGKPEGRGHQIQLINIEGKQWMSDVGFGFPGPGVPLPFEMNQTTNYNGFSYRFIETDKFGIMLQYKYHDTWKNLYSFDMNYVCDTDIVYANYYTSTHPKSYLTDSRIASIALKNGSITLYNQTLTKRVDGKEVEEKLPDGPAYLEALEKNFGIDLNIPYAELQPLPMQITN